MSGTIKQVVDHKAKTIDELEGEKDHDKQHVKDKEINAPQDNRVFIRFHLKDDSGNDLEFRKADPIWVSAVSCPTSACSNPEVEVERVQNKTLDIVDYNLVADVLYYTLVMDGTGGEVQLDPIIRNTGGGPPTFPHRSW